MIRLAPAMPALLSPIVLAGALLFAAHAQAKPPQPAGDDDEPPASVSRPVVEPTAPNAGKALNAALERLARDPRNADALLEAGHAAIALGDNEAALGFFTRADQITPDNAAVKAAIAGARLHLDDPVEALRWYADAERAGADPASFALDRGLAYDLVGDNVAAVAQYRKVIEHGSDEAMRDEATRREAVSLAIGGDRRAADLALLPLLQRQDRAAWRAHIFVLAIAGRSDDAVGVARATMPPDLAAAIGPYLRFMVQLTPAQQAAVASLGRFPRAAEIGRDDPRVVAYTAAHPRVPLAPAALAVKAATQTAAADADSRALRARRRRPQGTPAATVTAAVPAEPDVVLPPPPPPPGAAMVATAAPPVPPAASRTTTPARDGFDLGQVAGTTTALPTPATMPPPTVAARLPRPTVLSRLDMPPPPRRTSATVAPAVAASAATLAAIPEPPPASHEVVEPVPAQPATPRPEPAVARHGKAAAEKTAPAPDQASPARDKPGHDKAAHGKTGKDKVVDTAEDEPRSAKDAKDAKDKGGKTKSAHGKAGKDEDAEAALVPCKPAATGKGRKARAAVKTEHGRVARSKSRHGAKARKDTADTDTCAPVTHGDRPDGPGDVSRDNEDDSRIAKGKAKDKGKPHDKSADSEKPDKAGEKGGRHARYASRIWVEVLTGADRDKMPGEWRALLRKSHKLKAHKPYLTPWHSNFRLLTGPFDSDADAQDFIADLRKDGVSGFEWTSPAGQAIDSLALP
jgi:tetratricopeptide (TPR) repeat protein